MSKMHFSGAIRRAFAYLGNVEQLTSVNYTHRNWFGNISKITCYVTGQNSAYNGRVPGTRIMEISTTEYALWTD